MMRVISTLFAVVASAIVTGCHEPVAPTEPTSVQVQQDFDAFLGVAPPIGPTTQTGARVQAPGEAEFDRLWEAALGVLRQHDFIPARRDRRAGVIETLSTTAQNFFEFWRKDTIGDFETAEANLHTIRKYATVRVGKTQSAGGHYALTVEVQAERLSQPERQVTSAAGALRVFSETVPTQEGVFPGKPTWVPLGRDVKMERYLLGRILAQYGEPISLEEERPRAMPMPEDDADGKSGSR